MSRSETWEHKRVMRSKRKQDWYYSCTATQWWGTATESASFNYTDGGKALTGGCRSSWLGGNDEQERILLDNDAQGRRT